MPLIYFMLGVIFIRCILPLLDQLAAWTMTFIEYKKTKILLKTTKVEKRVEEIVNKEEVSTRQIGFVVENEDEYRSQEEDYDE